MSAIETLRQSVETKSMVRYKKQPIDFYSASAILAVYDKLSAENKIKYADIAEKDLIKAASIAFKLINRK